MASFSRFSVGLLCVVLVAAGCGGGDDSAGKPQACVPNASVGCTGPGSCSGYQVCAADGSGYSACDCGDAGSGGSAGMSGSGGTSGGGGSAPDGGGVAGVGGVGGGGASGGTGGAPAGGTGGSAVGGTGGTGTGGGGGDAATCSVFCQKKAAPKCPKDEPYAACYSSCVADLSTYKAACATETTAWYACFNSTATTVCNSMGYLKHSGCNTEWAAFLKCAGCVVTPSDTTCESCSKTKCCAQFQSSYTHPQLSSYLDCLYACTTSACEGGCASTYSSVIQAVTAASGCQWGSCKC